jgi:hypothetical protein
MKSLGFLTGLDGAKLLASEQKKPTSQNNNKLKALQSRPPSPYPPGIIEESRKVARNYAESLRKSAPMYIHHTPVKFASF